MKRTGRKISRVIFLVLVVLTVAYFWKLKDEKTILQASTAKPLTESQVGKDALDLQGAFVKVAELIGPAVVSITTVQMINYPANEFYYGDPYDFFREFFGNPNDNQQPKQKKPRQYKAEGGGSGVIIDERGYILTNEHVVDKADEIKVTVNIGGVDKTYTGKVVGKDWKTDLAVVKINAKDITAAPLGNSDDIRVGQWVMAIGSPFGLERTVTSGIVSAKRQTISIEQRVYKDFIQTDTAINRGNSGGPLCNIYGEVIGINTAIFAPTGVFSGIGFAIPINRAKEILDDLIRKGKVVRGWLGIEIKEIDDAILKQFGLKDKEGALVNSVMKDSPAAKGGMKRGDVIIEFDGQKVKSPSDLQSVVGKTGPKKQVSVKVIRDGSQKTLQFTTGEMPDEVANGGEEGKQKPGKEKEKEEITWLGMKVAELNDELMKAYNVPPDARGVIISDTGSDSDAREIGLEKGDVIASVNRMPTPDLDSFEKATKKVKLSDGVVFDIIRDGRYLYISYTSPE
jgi:serine protease Do